MNKIKKQARILRAFRKVHRKTGALLLILFFVVSISGLLLGWKKNSNGSLLPESEKGVSTDVSEWRSFGTLQTIAFKALKDSVDPFIDLSLKKIDARPEKGMVKFVFNNHYWGVQLDGATGEVLGVSRRRSDFVENIHDGSVLDIIFRTNMGILKLIYTTLMGLALLTFTVTGFWLWYGPKRLRKIAGKKRKKVKTETPAERVKIKV